MAFSTIPSAKLITPDKILGSHFYFHRNLSGIESFRFLNRSFPIYKDQNTYRVDNVPEGIFEVGSGWVTEAIKKNCTLTRSYNFLFSVWSHGNGNATFFFKFYAYRNNREIYLFTTKSSDLIPKTTMLIEMLWQHRIGETTIHIKEGDRLVLRLFINVTKRGDFEAGFDCSEYPSYVMDPTEVRYMRGDLWTINGLYGFKLQTVQSATGQLVLVSYSGDVTGYWGSRVWKRASNGTETEITSGDAVAVVSRNSDGAGLQSATWNCPETSLASTDAIVVRVYMDTSNPPATLRREFVTEQLGASKLDAETWTFYYYTEKSTAVSAKTHYTDYQNHTVNGQNHHKHITSRDSSSSFAVRRIGTGTAYASVRWFIVHSGGSEAELGESGTYKAVASRTTTGWAIGTYSLSETNITTTDAIKVKFYFRLGSSSFSESDYAMSFITTQLGVTKLYATTLQVNYYLLKALAYWEIFFGWYYDSYIEDFAPYSHVNGYKYEATTTLRFRHGTSTYNSRIENFAWSEAITKTWHSILWNLTLNTRKWFSLLWNLTLNVKKWNSILWNLTLISSLWHQITWSLILSLTKAYLLIPILFVALTTGILLFLAYAKDRDKS